MTTCAIGLILLSIYSNAKLKSPDNILDMLGFVNSSFELVDLSNGVSHSCGLRVCIGNAVDCAESTVRMCGYSLSRFATMVSSR